MRIVRATWPVWVALWGAVLPSFFLPHIDYYLYLHTGIEIVRIYGEAALLYLPLALAAIALIVAGAWLVPGTRIEFPARVRFASIWTARLLIVAAACELTNSWIRSLETGFQPSAPLKLLILCVSALGATVFTLRTAEPGRVLRGLGAVALWALPAALIALFYKLPAPPISTGFASAAREGAAAPANKGTAPRDIVLITVDTLSAMHMSVYGYQRNTTPNLQRFAAKATVFDRFYADGDWTQAGVASLLSGRRPWTTRSDNPNIGPAPRAMGANLLEIARDAGYDVLTVSTNVNAAPLRQKVDQWVEGAAFPLPTDSSMFILYATNQLEQKLGFFGESADQGFLQTVSLFKLQTLFDHYFNHSLNQHYDPRPAFSAAEELWQQHSGAPRFLWVHIMPPHDPYATPPPFLGTFDSSANYRSYESTSITNDFGSILWYQARDQSARLNLLANRYDESILYSDYYVGQFLDWLDQHGDLAPSLVIVTSDHGESFHHDYSGHGGPGLYEELIRIPLLIKYPDQNQQQRVSTLAEQADLVPTVAKLISANPPQLPYEGKALSPELTASGGPDRPVYSMSLFENPDLRELRTGSIAMVDGPYKYLHYFGNLRYPQMPPQHDQLYNVMEDALETHDLSLEQPEVAARMKSSILAEMSRQGQRFDEVQAAH